MSWLIVGTVPDENFPLVKDPCGFSRGKLHVGEALISVARGTPALMAAATIASGVLEIEPPTALLAGDIGNGGGSELVYKNLVDTLPHLSDSLIVFHYLQPDVDWHNRILMGLQEMPVQPALVADAGYMYVAKMSGFADCYDLFTPDIGELAFLADESAPHPFYTRGFLLQDEDSAEELITRAYEHNNAARYLLVKGKCDLAASREGVLERICEPCVENMEPIGGTGDTVTGLAAALIQSGAPIAEAAGSAALVNRFMGLYSNPTPAYSVSDLLESLEEALVEVMKHSRKEP
jgi:NAD(P)H-hydrate repair Nnr-like enzyme with NAD(P)H-hydrate dehydratase domain